MRPSGSERVISIRRSWAAVVRRMTRIGHTNLQGTGELTSELPVGEVNGEKSEHSPPDHAHSASHIIPGRFR